MLPTDGWRWRQLDLGNTSISITLKIDKTITMEDGFGKEEMTEAPSKMMEAAAGDDGSGWRLNLSC